MQVVCLQMSALTDVSRICVCGLCIRWLVSLSSIQVIFPCARYIGHYLSEGSSTSILRNGLRQVGRFVTWCYIHVAQLVQDWKWLHTAFYPLVCTCAYICHVHVHIVNRGPRSQPNSIVFECEWKTWKTQNWTWGWIYEQQTGTVFRAGVQQQSSATGGSCSCSWSPHPRRWPWMMDRFSLKQPNIQVTNRLLRPGVGRRLFCGFFWMFHEFSN